MSDQPHPEWSNDYFKDQPYAPPPAEAASGTPSAALGHVRIVAILMIVQGVLEILVGGFLLVMMGVLPWLFAAAAREDPAFNQQLQEGPMQTMVVVMYGAMGLPTLIAGLLHIIAGIRNYQFRNRVFGITALSVGLATVTSCYCAPTSIALTIYGLLIYLDRDVAAAFARPAQEKAGPEADFQP